MSHQKQPCQSILSLLVQEPENGSTSEAEAEAEAAGQEPCQQGEPPVCLLLASEDVLAQVIVQATVGHAEAATSGVIGCV